jgi:hypothetical protein
LSLEAEQVNYLPEVELEVIELLVTDLHLYKDVQLLHVLLQLIQLLLEQEELLQQVLLILLTHHHHL